MDKKVLMVVAAILCISAVKANDADDISKLQHLPRVKRVIGGVDIEKGEWPWLVSLKGKVPRKFFLGIPYDYKNFYCGGAVVHKRYVVTAAHCFSRNMGAEEIRTPKYWHNKVGEIERDHSTGAAIKSWFGSWWAGGKNWVIYNLHCEKIIIHPDYDEKDTWKNDIAVLKLEKDLPIDSDPDIELIDLPPNGTQNWPVADQGCVFKGWGCTTNRGPIADIAKAVTLPTISAAQCSMVYGPVDFKDSRVCAGNMPSDLQGNEERGICKGDSGGPLVCKRDNLWELCGIASFTSADRPGQVPSVFTRVSNYVTWIEETIQNN